MCTHTGRHVAPNLMLLTLAGGGRLLASWRVSCLMEMMWRMTPTCSGGGGAPQPGDAPAPPTTPPTPSRPQTHRAPWWTKTRMMMKQTRCRPLLLCHAMPGVTPHHLTATLPHPHPPLNPGPAMTQTRSLLSLCHVGPGGDKQRINKHVKLYAINNLYKHGIPQEEKLLRCRQLPVLAESVFTVLEYIHRITQY